MSRSALTIALLFVALLIVVGSIVSVPGVFALSKDLNLTVIVQLGLLSLGALIFGATWVFDKTLGSDIL